MAESKVISRLNINGKIITNQAERLKEEKSYYGKLYRKQEQKNSSYNFFDNNINNLNETDQNKCDGKLTEKECRLALKEMKNQKSTESDGITAEFYKIFWNDIKQFYVNSINYAYQCGELTELRNQSIYYFSYT